MEALIVLLFLLIIFIVLVLYNYEQETLTDVIGKKGENLVYNILEDMSDVGIVLSNLYIPTGAKGTTEIDTLFLTKDAVFVIESKNIYGYIKGLPFDDKWVAEREDKTVEFRNPILQNKNHIKYLERQLDVFLPVISICVFNDEADISNINIVDFETKIVHYSELENTVRSFLDDEKHIINDIQCNQLYKKLKKFADVPDEVKYEHQKYISEKYGNK